MFLVRLWHKQCERFRCHLTTGFESARALVEKIYGAHKKDILLTNTVLQYGWLLHPQPQYRTYSTVLDYSGYLVLDDMKPAICTIFKKKL